MSKTRLKKNLNPGFKGREDEGGRTMDKKRERNKYANIRQNSLVVIKNQTAQAADSGDQVFPCSIKF